MKSRVLESHWYRSYLTLSTGLLLPFSWVFGLMVWLRRFLYRIQLKKSYRAPVPVIIVGNITAGGTGKTPLVIWLAEWLQSQGYRPGIVSRGVGGKPSLMPHFVCESDVADNVGDEALLLFKRTSCPIVICKKRAEAVKTLLSKKSCDVIISDDGLQHYALQRDIEIAVIDGVRGLGNGCLLPAGPLRERISRLKKVNFVIRQGKALQGEYGMQLVGDYAVSLLDENIKKPLSEFAHQPVHLVAAIGHPERFFSSIKKHHVHARTHAFADHHLLKQTDICFDDDLPVLMTEKDAVKCKAFADQRHWYVPVVADVDGGLIHSLKRIITAHVVTA